jgi:cell division protein FtsI/penicillin-binding protein 2
VSISVDARWSRIPVIAAACLSISLGGAAAETAKPLSIKTADGVALTESNGAPARAAAELALANIIGWGPMDAAGLTGILARSTLTDAERAQREATLTIDSRAQKIVQETLAYHLTRIIDDKDKPRRFFGERRAAFVLMDADTGALVAVGSWPPPPADAGPAAYEKLAREPQREDPRAVPAWRLPAKNDPAGSGLKALVALAAALDASDPAAKADERLAPMLLGMDAASYKSRFGMDMTAGRVPIAGSPYTVENIGGAPTSTSGPLRSPVCHGEAAVPAASTLNVSLAIKHSYSAYFARLALLLDERTVDAWSKELMQERGRVLVPVSASPETRLARRFAQMGIDSAAPVDLGANLGASVQLARLRGETLLDRLYAPPAAFTARPWLPEGLPQAAVLGDFRYRIALAGVGTAWHVTPLHLATGAAAIARGERVQPHLVASLGAAKLASPAGEKLALRADLLAAIRLGMKAVAEAPGATMSSVAMGEPKFVLGQEYEKAKEGELGRRVAALRQATTKDGVKPIWCRLYAKTGTAEGAIPGTNTGWVMGWKEPLQSGGRRLAFACMVSHLDWASGGPRFGGAVCGSLLRDISLSLETMSPPDLKAN